MLEPSNEPQASAEWAITMCKLEIDAQNIVSSPLSNDTRDLYVYVMVNGELRDVVAAASAVRDCEVNDYLEQRGELNTQLGLAFSEETGSPRLVRKRANYLSV